MSQPYQTPAAQKLPSAKAGINGASVASIDKLYKVQTKTTYPQKPFNGQQYQVEISLPSFLGKVTESVVQFDLTFSSSNAAAQDLVVLPTTLWCDRIEYMYDGQVLESQDSDISHLFTLAFLQDQDYATIQNAVNIGYDGSFADAMKVGGGTSVTKTYYLPLWSGLLASFQPFVKGFSGEWRIRLYLTPKLFSASQYTGASPSEVSIDCNELCMWVTESQLSDEANIRLMNAHKRGIVYRGIIQNKWTQQENSVTGNAEYRRPMTTFASDSAGLLVYSRPNTLEPVDALKKDPLSKIAILDSAGAELTQRLPVGLINAFISPDTTPLTTYFSDPDVNNFYLFPFCSSLAEVWENGKNLGGIRFSGNEQLVIVPPTTLTSVLLNVVSYEYCQLKVARGRATLERHV